MNYEENEWTKKKKKKTSKHKKKKVAIKTQN